MSETAKSPPSEVNGSVDRPRAKPHVVIVGAGFGGLNAAWTLRRAKVEVTIIDRRNYHLFQPLLYQVATAGLSPANIAYPIRSIVRRNNNTNVLLDEVREIDIAARRVTTTQGRIDYDFLIVAAGAGNSYFGHDEWAPFAPGLKSLDDALDIRRRILLAFELAEREHDEAARRVLLTFVVVGGGPTGVELAGTIAELCRSTLARDFRRINPASARIILFEAGPHLLSAFPRRLSGYARKTLDALGVEVRTGVAVDHIDADGLAAGRERIATHNILWCAGTTARPAAKWLAAEAAKNGAVKVAADCSVPGHPTIFAVGDVASSDAGGGRTLPGLAPVAKQQGTYVGALLKARIAGRREPRPFHYRDLGTLAVIGRSRAVADFGWLRLTGFTAWLTWSLVHLMLLVDFRSRLMVYANWSWAWFTHGRGARLVVRHD